MGIPTGKLPEFRAADPRQARTRLPGLPRDQRTDQVGGVRVNARRNVFRNGYFPSAAALALVALYWCIAMYGGLSLLSKSHPPVETLVWLLLTYASAALSLAMGVWAAGDLWLRLSRRWKHAPEPF
jgi:hypothetical protein